VLLASAVACGAVIASQPALASQQLTSHAMSVPAATVVNVSTLPPAAPGAPAAALPQLEPPAATPAADAVPAAASRVGPAAKPVLTLGTVLPSPLKGTDNAGALAPPDQAVAAGPGSVVQMVNLVGRIWTGTTVVTSFPLSSFFGTGSDSISDPWLFYDAATGRFFASIFDITHDGEAVAVSQTSNPGGAWNRYFLGNPAAGSGTCPDQGKLGVSDTMVSLGTNLFTTCAAGGSYVGAVLEVFTKSEMLAGTSPVHGTFATSGSLFSMVPAVSTSSTTTQFWAGVNPGSGNSVQVVTATGSPAAASFNLVASVGIPAFSAPPESLQKGSTATIDSGDARMERVAWQNGLLGFSFNESCVPAGDTVARACVRFADVKTATETLAWSKTIGRKLKYLFYGAPAFNSNGVLVASFCISSKKTFPGLDAIAFTKGGGASAIIPIAAGTGPETSGRYGDYSAVAIDPTTPTAFWAAGEIGFGAGFGNWGTAVAHVTVS
jgi:hypothetical protein